MSVDDALEQIDNVGHDFYIFLDAASGEVSLLVPISQLPTRVPWWLTYLPGLSLRGDLHGGWGIIWFRS